jgi:hypothetical protein
MDSKRPRTICAIAHTLFAQRWSLVWPVALSAQHGSFFRTTRQVPCHPSRSSGCAVARQLANPFVTVFQLPSFDLPAAAAEPCASLPEGDQAGSPRCGGKELAYVEVTRHDKHGGFLQDKRCGQEEIFSQSERGF